MLMILVKGSNLQEHSLLLYEQKLPDTTDLEASTEQFIFYHYQIKLKINTTQKK